MPWFGGVRRGNSAFMPDRGDYASTRQIKSNEEKKTPVVSSSTRYGSLVHTRCPNPDPTHEPCFVAGVAIMAVGRGNWLPADRNFCDCHRGKGRALSPLHSIVWSAERSARAAFAVAPDGAPAWAVHPLPVENPWHRTKKQISSTTGIFA